MRLSKEAIEEFKEIYYQEFGEKISDWQPLCGSPPHATETTSKKLNKTPDVSLNPAMR